MRFALPPFLYADSMRDLPKPSEIAIVGVTPFVGVFDRAEEAVACALLVRAFQRREPPEWGDVSLVEILDAVGDPDDLGALACVHVVSPDFEALLTKGLAAVGMYNSLMTLQLTRECVQKLPLLA